MAESATDLGTRVLRVISRSSVRCPGCDKTFTARLDLQPTQGTRFYLLCPHCKVPITGTQDGDELPEHRVRLDAEMVPESELPEGAPVVTVNPFIPARHDADSFDGPGAMPTLTLLYLTGQEGFSSFSGDHGLAQHVLEENWPPTRRLFDYYLQERWDMFDRSSTAMGRPPKDGTVEDRSNRAYSALAEVTANTVGHTGERGELLFERFGRKHLAATAYPPYLALLGAREQRGRDMERDTFGAIKRFLEIEETWSMGRLPRFVRESAVPELEKLTLFRDEFALVRDVYQQGFEQAGKCLWLLIAAQNSVKRKDPNTFGEHPSAVSPKNQVSTLAQFDKLPNAFKIAYAAQVPGWGSVQTLLNSQRRNAIGHGSARHDLSTGRVVSEKDPAGVTYLDFLAETFGVFEILAALMQTIRAARVVSSQVNGPPI